MNPSRPSPKRAPGVTSRAIGDGFVVIEPVTQTAHSLEDLSATVWRSLADGTLPAAPSDEVNAVLLQLTDLGLVKEPAGGFSRRSVLKKSGLVVAGAGIVTIALPSSMAAASPDFDFAAGKTTAGPIFVQVPANPGAPRNLTLTLTGANGAPGSAGGNGGGGSRFTFTIRQPTGPAFTLLGFVGGGGKYGGAPAANQVHGEGGVSGGAFTAAGGDGGSGGNRDGGGGGAATYITDSGGNLVAVAAGGGGGGAASSTTAGGVGGAGSAALSNLPSTSNSGGPGTAGADSTGAGSTYFGSPGATQATTSRAAGAGNPSKTAGLGGVAGSSGFFGDDGSPGATGAGTGAGGNGGSYTQTLSGSGGGGGGGYAGGGGGGSGSVNIADTTQHGGGAGGGGGSNYLARTTDTFTGFAVLTSGSPASVTNIAATTGTSNGPDGSFAITG